MCEILDGVQFIWLLDCLRILLMCLVVLFQVPEIEICATALVLLCALLKYIWLQLLTVQLMLVSLSSKQLLLWL